MLLPIKIKFVCEKPATLPVLYDSFESADTIVFPLSVMKLIDAPVPLDSVLGDGLTICAVTSYPSSLLSIARPVIITLILSLACVDILTGNAKTITNSTIIPICFFMKNFMSSHLAYVFSCALIFLLNYVLFLVNFDDLLYLDYTKRLLSTQLK